MHERAWLRTAAGSLVHRGPDDYGEWWSDDGKVGFAHRRLAILDLSPEGKQPMCSTGQKHWIVFNGEIYNFVELRELLTSHGYHFHSRSDTEVLLAAYDRWGVNCTQYLNGMFAFAIYDSVRERVFLARDRAGEKPLFYRWSGDAIFFSSELKALLSNPGLPRQIDPTSLDCYLAMGFVPAGRCILRGYNKLPPAHALELDLQLGELKTWRYWELPDSPDAASAERIDELGLLEELETLLEDSVAKQMVADVPVGILLSGGVDSSLVTAFAARRQQNVNTFSVTFPGNGRFDETEHARLIANQFGTSHTELVADASAGDLLPMLPRFYDEPIVDSSMLPTWMVSKLVREHCTVALGGDGGDELFGGYGHHSRLLWMSSRVGGVPLAIRQLAADGATRLLPVGFKGRNWMKAVGTDFHRGLPLVAHYFDKPMRKSLFHGRYRIDPAAEDIFAARVPDHPDLLERATRMDFSSYLPEDILVKVDRASMANSLEIRAPFLDYRVVEFAFGKVPGWLKTTPVDRKVILKRLCERLLPADFDRKRKQGFGIPLDAWLRSGRLRDQFREVLFDPSTPLNQTVVRSLLSAQDRGRANGERLFGLVLLELWRREYRIDF